MNLKNIMVCVTLQSTCERLIDYAKVIKEPDDNLFVLHVAKNTDLNKGEILEFLYSVSHSAGADMTVLYSDDALNTISNFIKEKAIDTVILGKPENTYKDNGFITALTNKFADNIEFILLDKKEF